MLPAGWRIFRFVLFGELRQLVFCYGFFEVHKFNEIALVPKCSFQHLCTPQELKVFSG